ncbi:MAG TPA: hypothetical protein VM370_00455 [Candidatus Thermoplasmatota archaeon]|nr:hypothetical protein [Candidatus Thermoplasmatota archaeon]
MPGAETAYFASSFLFSAASFSLAILVLLGGRRWTNVLLAAFLVLWGTTPELSAVALLATTWVGPLAAVDALWRAPAGTLQRARMRSDALAFLLFDGGQAFFFATSLVCAGGPRTALLVAGSDTPEYRLVKNKERRALARIADGLGPSVSGTVRLEAEARATAGAA